MELRHDYSNPKVRDALERATNAGSAHGCPFCLGRMIGRVSLGERIVLLKGWQAGRVGTCVNEIGYTTGEFMLRFDDQEEEYQTRIIYNRDEFLNLPPPKLPGWILSLSIDDNNCIENEIINLMADYAIRNKWDSSLVLPLAHRIWWRRLPINAEEVWQFLEAHGAPSKLKRRFLVELNVAVIALRYSNGRAPIKKKRMRPFEVGTYMSTNQRRIFNLIHRIAGPT